MRRDQSSEHYDAAFKNVKGLVWLPWVGDNYPNRPPTKRLLIVPESHYVKAGGGEDDHVRRKQLEKLRKQHTTDKRYTRAVVSGYCVNDSWGCYNRTLDGIPKTLFGTIEIDRERFWSDAAFYNFVQRPMDYQRQGGPEQATLEDFSSAWLVFSEVIKILEPSHCLFFGVRASNTFNAIVIDSGIAGQVVTRREQINNVWPREAAIEVDNRMVPLTFLKHPAKFFSPGEWNRYLTAHHSALMKWIREERYFGPTSTPSRP